MASQNVLPGRLTDALSLKRVLPTADLIVVAALISVDTKLTVMGLTCIFC